MVILQVQQVVSEPKPVAEKGDFHFLSRVKDV